MASTRHLFHKAVSLPSSYVKWYVYTKTFITFVGVKGVQRSTEKYREYPLKKITLQDDSYWKLLEIKVKLKCGTWKETIERLYKSVLNQQKEKKFSPTE